MVSDKRVIMLEVSTDEKQGLRYMLLRQRVAQMMDSTGWTSVLILFDVVVSVLSVVIYIVMTYQIKYQVLNSKICDRLFAPVVAVAVAAVSTLSAVIGTWRCSCIISAIGSFCHVVSRLIASSRCAA
eukprot:GHRR01025019.1.p2 GENE.GHRR01025019.1~~GHRR01025019.1.p2  ORF type:complete len:127 (+),score=39.62 GHRR01025019.1:450-830(+)